MGTFQVNQKNKYLYPVLLRLDAMVVLRVFGIQFLEHCDFCFFLLLYFSVPFMGELQKLPQEIPDVMKHKCRGMYNI